MNHICRWLVVRKRGEATPEVFTFDNCDDAEAFYTLAKIQWPDTLLCPVFRGAQPTPALDRFRELLGKLKRSPAMGIGGPAGSVGKSLLEVIECLGDAVADGEDAPGYQCNGTCGGRSIDIEGEQRCASGCAKNKEVENEA